MFQPKSFDVYLYLSCVDLVPGLFTRVVGARLVAQGSHFSNGSSTSFGAAITIEDQ